MRLAHLAAAVAASILATACSHPRAPSDLVAERTDDLLEVQLRWGGACVDRCEIAVDDEVGRRIISDVALPGATSHLLHLPRFAELAIVTIRVRNVDGDDESGWTRVPFQMGIWPVSIMSVATSWWLAGDARRSVTCEWQHGSVHADGSLLERRITGGGAPAEAPWEIMPVDRGATEFADPEGDRWVDRAVFAYRVRSLAGEIPSAPLTLSSSPAPPAPPADVSLALDGDVLRLRWRNRSTIAAALEVAVERSVVATLPPQAEWWEEPAPGPGFFRRGVQAVVREPASALWGQSGFAEATLFVPDPGLDPVFAQATTVLPSAEVAARMPDGGWALGKGLFGRGPADIRLPYGGNWSVWQSPLSGPWAPRAAGNLAAPGPLVGANGRVHAITIAGWWDARPVLHVWWEDGEWHEEEIGFADVPYSQMWAALDAQGYLHALWRSGAGVATATYATNRGGSWISEEVPGAAFAADDEVRRPLAVTPEGEAVVVFPAPDGEPGFVLHRRLADGWTAERIPDGLAIAPGPLALVAASSERISWLAACAGEFDVFDVCLRERTQAGWGRDELLEPGVRFYYDSILAAASPDANRVAYALPVGGGRLRLHLHEGATRATHDLAAASEVGAVGFTQEGKAWVLTGLSHPVPWSVTYLVYEER